MPARKNNMNNVEINSSAARFVFLSLLSMLQILSHCKKSIAHQANAIFPGM
jgi:hypothetical protein